MPDTTLPDQAAALHDRYRRAFAGRARVSRDLAALDGLIADTEALLPALAQSTSLRGEVGERLATYRKERETIATIQAGGEDARVAWRHVEWTEANLSRYRREFGGQNRSTRDLGLLQELAAEEARALAAAAPLAKKLAESNLSARVDELGKNVALYTEEVGRIRSARAALRPVDRVATLAALANRQFGLYRTHFEGKPRASRRAGLLERIHANLTSIHQEMLAARDAGVTASGHAENIGKVAARVSHHRDEVAKIKEAVVNTPTSKLAPMLGDDANAWIARYRAEFAGKPRQGRNLAALAEICDGLHEVARTMRDLGGNDPGNEKNLAVVMEHLKIAEREYGAIRTASRAAQTPVS
ncbi:MAG: hypothetical protein EXR71_09880 [Myxococcales bacterium]|nr:hypothetical protein [Myxococcales bacterium]